MTKRTLIAVLLLTSALSAQSTKRAGAIPIASFAANCIPKAVTAITLSCSPLFAVDANTVRQANTTTNQLFEIYGTTDSNATPVNYEKLVFGYNAINAGNAFQIGTVKGGSGTLRALDLAGGGTVGILSSGGSRVFIVNTTGNISQYGNVLTVGEGVVPLRGTLLASTGQVGSLGATTILTGGAATAGLYRVCYQASTTTSGTGTTGTVTIAWNDGNAKSFTTGTWALNAVDVTGQVNGCQVFRVAASQNITVATTIGAIGTSVYRVDAQAEQLQ